MVAPHTDTGSKVTFSLDTEDEFIVHPPTHARTHPPTWRSRTAGGGLKSRARLLWLSAGLKHSSFLRPVVVCVSFLASFLFFFLSKEEESGSVWADNQRTMSAKRGPPTDAGSSDQGGIDKKIRLEVKSEPASSSSTSPSTVSPSTKVKTEAGAPSSLSSSSSSSTAAAAARGGRTSVAVKAEAASASVSVKPELDEAAVAAAEADARFDELTEFEDKVKKIMTIIKRSSTKSDVDKTENLNLNQVNKVYATVQRGTLVSMLVDFARNPGAVWEIPQWFKEKFEALNCAADSKLANNVTVEMIVCRAVARMRGEHAEEWGWFGQLVLDNDWTATARKARAKFKQERVHELSSRGMACKNCKKDRFVLNMKGGKVVCTNCGCEQDGRVALPTRNVMTDDGDDLRQNGRPMDAFQTSTTYLTTAATGTNDHAQRMRAGMKKANMNFQKSETASVGHYRKEHQKQQSYALITEICKGMHFFNMDAVVYLAKKSFQAFRENQRKLRNRLAVITACIMTGFEFARCHERSTQATGYGAKANTDHEVVSFRCGDFWAWEASPIASDAVASRSIGFFSGDDLNRWDGVRV